MKLMKRIRGLMFCSLVFLMNSEKFTAANYFSTVGHCDISTRASISAKEQRDVLRA